MLDGDDLDKLCFGRVIFADVYESSNTKPAGPHYAVILDSDEQIKKSGRFKVVVISHNTVIDPNFNIPVPAWTGLNGFIVGSWTTVVHEPGIKKIGHKLNHPEMVEIIRLVARADAADKQSRE